MEKKTYSLTFLPEKKKIEVPVEPKQDGRNEGEPGSVLDWAFRHGIEIDHACGGFAACSTCHIVVKKGLETCSEPSEDEEDMLDEAPGVTAQSRLACQCVPDGTQEVEIEIPSWNRNLVRGH